MCMIYEHGYKIFFKDGYGNLNKGLDIRGDFRLGGELGNLKDENSFDCDLFAFICVLEYL